MTTSLFTYLIIILFGLVLGSFLNVVILRFDELRTIIKVRSHCPKCKKNLAWYDLIPFFSYVILAGRCRKCKKSISIQYPLVEAGTAVILVLLYWQFGLTFQFAALAIVSALLVIIFVYDILHLLVADILIYLGLFVWFVFLLIQYGLIDANPSAIFNSLLGGAILGGFLGLMVLVSREKWMGKGDIALGALLGTIVGFPNVILAGLLSFVLGSILGVLLILSKKKSLKDKVPFAPFLIIATWISLFFSSQIISWYWSSIF